MKNIGITSENIRTATLLSSDNKYLTYPCKVLLNVWERGIDGSIIVCTVSTGGAFVGARNAKLADVSEELSYKYQEFNPSDLKHLLN